MCSGSGHVGRMYVGVRLHLVHAVVARLRVAEAVLSAVRRALLRLRMQWLTVAVQGLWRLLGGGCLEPCGLAVHRGGVRRIRASNRTATYRITSRRRVRRRAARECCVGLDLGKTLDWSSRLRRVLRVVPGVDGAAGVDRRDRWQLQLYGIDRISLARARYQCRGRFW
jgi:hypothetical protein